MESNLLSVKDVAEYLGIGLTRAYELFHSKGFPCFKTGDRALRIRKNKLDAWINKREAEYER